MTTKETLSRLLELLVNYEYTILDFPLIVFGRSFSTSVLLKKDDLKLLIEEMKALPGIEGIKLSSQDHHSSVDLSLQNKTSLVVDVYHDFVSGKLNYLNTLDVLAQKRDIKDGIYLPSYEHQLEFAILSSFLFRKSVNQGYFQYFNEMHFLIQDDLLDNFNKKFGTDFPNMYSLTIFDETKRESILKTLASTPANGFMSQMNTRWHNFMGNMKQARLF